MSYKIAVLITLLVVFGVADTGCSISNPKSNTATGLTSAESANDGARVDKLVPGFSVD